MLEALEAAILVAQVADLVLVEAPLPTFWTRRHIHAKGVKMTPRSAARIIFSISLDGVNRILMNVVASGLAVEVAQPDLGPDREEGRRLLEHNPAIEAFVTELGLRHLVLDLPDLGARQEGLVVVVEQHQEQRPRRPLELGQLEVGVVQVGLGEHALPLADLDEAELAAEVALLACGVVVLAAGLRLSLLLLAPVVQDLEEVAPRTLDVAVRVEDVRYEDLPPVRRALSASGHVDQIGEDLGLDATAEAETAKPDRPRDWRSKSGLARSQHLGHIHGHEAGACPRS